MTKRNFDFNIFYQRTLLHRILSDKKYANQAIPLLKTDVFDSEPLKWVCKKILDGYTTIRILVNQLKNEKSQLNDDLRKAIVSDIREFKKPFDEDESRYAVNMLREFVECQDIHEALKEAAIEADEGACAEDLRKILHKAVYSSRSIGNVTVDPISSLVDRFEHRKNIVESGDLIFVSSGFNNIDRDIGGPKLGQFWVFFGDTNLGKSQAAVSAAKINMLRGYKTLHFSLEDLLDVTLQRYDASLTKITHDKLTRSDLTEAEQDTVIQVYNLLLKKRNDYLRVSKIEEGATVQDLQSELKRLQSRDNFFPQVVLIDSPHDMESVRKMENFRLSQRQLYKEIRDFAQTENVALIAYDQSKQEVKGKIADTSAASESYDKARIVDGFVTMNQTKMQKKDGLIELFTAKMKDRDKHRSYIVRPNFKISRFVSIERG